MQTFFLLLILALGNGIQLIDASLPPSAGTGTGKSKMLALRGGSNAAEVSAWDWRFFAAGGIAAACSHGITTPIDVVKTRMQSDPEKYTQGVIQAAKDIVRVEGLGFLLAGLGPTVVGYGLEGGLKFGFYETFKKLLATATPIKVVNFLMASVIAGGVASIVLCPMEETRIKMVGDASWTKENIITGLVRLVREDGIFSSFGGLPAMLSKQIPYTMGKQVSFDIITKVIYGLVAHFALSASDLTWTISVASAFIASLFACLSSQPGDMILTATYKAAAGSDKSFGGVVSNILKTRGVGGFFIGLQARFAHVASIITSQLVIYDIVKVALGLPSTGAH